jgi:phosphoglycerate dehydrogenase-like enzyme
MRNLPRLLLWTDTPGPYIDAIAEAGLSDRATIDTLARGDKPSDIQRAETNVLLAAGVPPGLLPTMPSLRWAQSLTAGVEGWLALPDLPSGLTLTCARGTHRESMPENILGALFHITKPYAAISEDQKQSLWRHRVATPSTARRWAFWDLAQSDRR